MIPSTILQFPLVSGVNEGVDPRTVKPGTVTRLKNAAWTKDGRLDKRFGTSVRTQNKVGGGTIAAGKRLVTRGDELCMTDGSSLYSWSTYHAAWKDVGKVPEVGLEWSTLAMSSQGIRTSDVAVLGDGRIVHVWVTGDPTTSTNTATQLDLTAGTLVIQILDGKDGTRLQTWTNTSNAFYQVSKFRGCRILVNGNDWAVVTDYVQTGEILRISSSFSIAVLANDAYTATWSYCPFDAQMISGGGGDFILAYDSTAGTRLRVRRYTFAGALVTNGNVAGPTTALQSIGLEATEGEGVWVAFGYDGGSSRTQIAINNTTTLVQVLAPTNLDTTTSTLCMRVAVMRLSSTMRLVAYSSQVTPDTVAHTYQCGAVTTRTVTNAGVLAGKRVTWFADILSRPFTVAGRHYMLLADAGQSDAAEHTPSAEAGFQQFPGVASYLVEIETTEPPPTVTKDDPHRLVGIIDILIAGGWDSCCVPSTPARASTEVFALAPFLAEAEFHRFGWSQGARLVSVLSGASVPPDQWRPVELAGEALFAGPCLTSYDGFRPFDYGFPRPSHQLQFTTTSGVGSMAVGAYQYATHPEFRSMTGLVHRGPASNVTRHTLAATGSVNVKIVQQSLAGKWYGADAAQSGFQLRNVLNRIFRSTVNNSVLYALTQPPSTNSQTNEPNDSLGTQTFNDARSDADFDTAGSDLNQQPAVYTTSEYDDFAPPANLTVRVHKNRLFVLAGDRKTVWFSKDYSENPGTAPGFNPSAILTFDRKLVTFESMDNYVVFFSEDGIWYTTGEGPAVNGDGSDYQPAPIQTDVGCTNPRSVVGVPNGVMFQGARGLYLLTRNLELVWLGKPVQDTLASYPVITSAVLVASLNQVRFTCNNVAGTEGVVLVFDHVREQWSVFEYADGVTAKTPIADSLLFDGSWTFLTPGGKVFQEDSTTYLDAGSWVTSDVETSWVFAEGPLSWQRVRRIYVLGERLTDCDVTLRVGVDGAASYDQTRTWTRAELTTVGSAKIGVHVRKQKCEAIRLRVTDATPTGGSVGTGQGINLSALGFEIAPKRGLEKRRAEARK